QTITGRLFQGLRQLVTARKRTLALHARTAVTPVWTHNDQVLGLVRDSAYGRLLILANFSEHQQTISRARLQELGFGGLLVNRLDEQFIPPWHDLNLEPYQSYWLVVIN
ncbi:MAG TPA: alpha-amylase, partial [Chloroflexota bacterium]|nr:alpha-amylase [Chloroflexota bacterium]